MSETSVPSAALHAPAQAKPDPATDGAWGKPVEGVQVRLVADRSQWKAGETPTLVAEIRDLRERGLDLFPDPWIACLEIDGIPYTRNSDVKFNMRLPGRESRLSDMVIKLDPNLWVNEGGKQPDLKPGKHTVRVTLIASVPRISADDDRLIPGLSAKSRSVTVISRLVEVEILGPEPAKADTP